MAANDNPGALRVGVDVFLDGYLETAGDVIVAGQLLGEVRAPRIIVEDGGFVSGNLIADEVIISGTAQDVFVYAGKIELTDGCRVTGELYHKHLNVAAQSFFEGKSRRHPNPLELVSSEAAGLIAH
ncbi:MAG: polymer-forming cytoskeletal protein [Hyphomicrobiaceae bacterium]